MLDFVKHLRRGDNAAALPPEIVAPAPKLPSIGLALGGGGARGFAHIGVLRTLAAHGIKPDVIAGTSIGAVVGGCYAAGKLDEFESWARGLTRRRIFGLLDFSIAGAGLIGGSRLSERLTGAIGDATFSDLDGRFAAIATEIGTGHEIWLTRGRVKDALRASYALPGMFPPVKIGGRWLMDGALVNPVPVTAARACGARMVIAVNLNTEAFGRGTVIQDHGPDENDVAVDIEPPMRGIRGRVERLRRRQFVGEPGKPGFSSVMVEAFSVMQDRITRARLAGDPPDEMISPKMPRVGFFDFHRAEEAIAAGAEAAEKAVASIAEAMAVLA